MPELQQSQQPTSNWTDIHGVCKHLNVSKETVYRMVKAGTLPHHKINSSLRFDLNEVDASIKKLKTESPAKRSSSPTSASKGRKSKKKK